MSERSDFEFIKSAIGKSYKDKIVLITGSRGFFGSWLARSLYDEKYSTPVILADRYNQDEVLKTFRPDYIFHFAPTPIEPVIECAKRSNAKVLYASSGAVYGGVSYRTKETDSAIPVTPYGMEKLRNENVLINSGLDYCIARLFAFAGTGMKNNFAITNFVENARNNKPIFVLNKDTVRTYLYIADAIVWMLKLMLSDNGIYNVGSEKFVNIGKLSEIIGGITETKVEYNTKPFIESVLYYVPDCSKAKNNGLAEYFSLRYMILNMLENETKMRDEMRKYYSFGYVGGQEG